jgi:hypothetical protein
MNKENIMKKTSENTSLINLYRLGGYSAFFQATSVIFAIIGYFIWPHIFTDAKVIFEGIQNNPLVFFMKLDPIVLIGTLLQLPVWLGLWASLKKNNSSFSILALLIGLISTIAVLPTRPLIELYSLSSLYSATDILSQKEIYIAAGETLLSQFHGTSWAISIMTGGLAAIIFGILMRRNKGFQSITKVAMIASGIGALFVLVPKIGIMLLFFLATIGGVIASIFTGVDLLRLYKKECKEE